MFRKGISFISKDSEEILRQKLKQTIEDRENPKSTLYPSNSKDSREQIDLIMLFFLKKKFVSLNLNESFLYRKEIDEFVENESQTKKEIKFTEL